jgi:hypothetical protein
MDGLALLCNLHADGPLTLRRLRQSGIRSLADLEKAPRESLGGLLRSSDHQARRFLVEASLLTRRTDDERATSRPVASPSDGERPEQETTRPGVVEASGPMREAFDSVEPKPKAEPIARKRPAFELPPNARRPQGFDTGPAVAEPVARASYVPVQIPPDRSVDKPPAPSATRAPREEPGGIVEELQEQGTLLRSGQIPGLDSVVLEKLIAQGVRTYRSLVELASLALARRAGIPFTKLLDLRYHAGRFLAERLFPGGLSLPEVKQATGSGLKEIVLVPTGPTPFPPRLESTSARSDRSYEATEAMPPEVLSPEREGPAPPGVAGPFV